MSISLRGLIGCVAVLAVVGPAAPALAETYHVDAGKGDDTRTPEQARQSETPWATLQRAADAVRAGDTVLVQEGTYAAGAVVKAKGTAEAPIVLKALGAVVIRNTRELPKEIAEAPDMPGVYAVPDPGPISYVWADPGKTRLLVDQFLPLRGKETLETAKGWSKLRYDADTQTLLLKPHPANMDLSKRRLVASRIGTALKATGTYITFDGFRVEFAGVGVQLEGEHNTARRIWAHNCQQGMQIGGRHNTVERCVVHACQGGISPGQQCVIRNNTIYGTRSYGISFGRHQSGTIVNNIIFAGGVSGGCGGVDAGAKGKVTMDHNVWLKYANRRGRLYIYRWDTKKVITSLAELRELGFGQHSLQMEPGFISDKLGELDLRLRTRAAGYLADSPCINAGTPAGTDIGAFQVPTPVPQKPTAAKVRGGVRLGWSLPPASDTIIAGFYVYSRNAIVGTASVFKRIATLPNPAAREFIDARGAGGYEYRITSYRPGGKIESRPSETVTVH